VVSGTADANGDLTLTWRPSSSRQARATQVTAEMDDAGSATAKVRLNGALITPILPTGGAAGGEPYIWVGPGDELTVTWAGAPAGGLGRMVVIYDYGTEQ